VNTRRGFHKGVLTRSGNREGETKGIATPRTRQKSTSFYPIFTEGNLEVVDAMVLMERSRGVFIDQVAADPDGSSFASSERNGFCLPRNKEPVRGESFADSTISHEVVAMENGVLAFCSRGISADWLVRCASHEQLHLIHIHDPGVRWSLMEILTE